MKSAGHLGQFVIGYALSDDTLLRAVFTGFGVNVEDGILPFNEHIFA
jgi:hypothetical protein